MASTNIKTPKKFTFKMQNKLLFIFAVVTLLFGVLIVRLVYLNNEDGERYQKQVLSRQSYVSAVIPFKRGDILDRNGTVLATSILQYKLIIDPKKLLSCETDVYGETLVAIETHFGINQTELSKKIQSKPKSQYYIVKKQIGYNAMNEFEELIKKEDSKIIGVWFEQEYVRNYPQNTLACDLIGFSNSENTGFYGLEEYYNDSLNGTNGREYGYYNSELKIDRIVKKAVNGNSIISTIDSNIQRIVQENINEFNSTIGSENIGIIVMNPNNGEIYAMASNEEYDLNNPRDLSVLYSEEEINTLTEEEKSNALNALWQNFCITSSYEPGSTYKPFTVAAALEEALVSENTTFVCDGHEYIGVDKVNCVNRSGHGLLNLAEAIMKSCNDALMHIAQLEGKTMFSNYQATFNMGMKTGIDLPGEATGIIRPLKDMVPIDLATNSFGQNFNTTMIQMAACFSSLVNGGYYYEPHIMKSIISDSGATVMNNENTVTRQTISAQTSELLKKFLYWTVEEGTAKLAKVAGYTVGGKTGTAQKYPRAAKKYLVSFIGCVPAMNPEVVIYVVIDEAKNVTKQDDSSLATKLASKVLNEILPHLMVYPEGEIDYLLDELHEMEEQNHPTQGTNENPSTEGGTTNSEAGTTNPETQTTNPETQTTNPEPETTNPEPETTNPETQTTNSETGTTNPETPITTPENPDQSTQLGNNEDEFNGDVMPESDYDPSNITIDVSNPDEPDTAEPIVAE